MLARILIFQTAFTGDVILTLPMIQRLKAALPQALVDVVVTPAGASVLANHPAISRVLVYDKKGTQRGVRAAHHLAKLLRGSRYDVALIPHRSLRSAAVCYAARIPQRVGFSTSAGRFLLTDVVTYRTDEHEILRNMSLLAPLGVSNLSLELPNLYPTEEDRAAVISFLHSSGVKSDEAMIAIAPGSVWATKRWLPERYRELSRELLHEGMSVVLVGGNDDVSLGNQICSGLESGFINAIGKLTLLQSAELIRRCKVLVSNDSTPMHLAVAMRTPVVAIFGATVPAFGFAPVGPRDQIVETNGLPCRPCAIHGGNRCPIGTFDCMTNITVQQVLQHVHAALKETPAGVP